LLANRATNAPEIGNEPEKQLAVLAAVSAPTLNRFERQHANITLHSAFAILNTLGLING
jgi:hypothetical protein